MIDKIFFQFHAKFCFIVFFSALIVISCKEEVTQPVDEIDPDAIKILFIGNSYMDVNNLPYTFKGFTDNSGKKIYLGADIVLGTKLDYHVHNNYTYSLISSLDWDYIILQGDPGSSAYPETEQIIFPDQTNHNEFLSMTTMKDYIKVICPSAKIIYIMPWAYEDGILWIAGQTDTYEDMQKKIYNNTMQWCKDLNIITAPVGWTWYEIMKENKQLHYLFLDDYNHPSQRGTYITASVLYSTIFKRSTVDIPYYYVFSKEEATYFQNTSSKVVMDSLSLWYHEK